MINLIFCHLVFVTFYFDSGSALHRHLLESGLGDVELSSPASSDRSFSFTLCNFPFSRICLSRSLASELAALEEREHTPAELLVCGRFSLPASNIEH